MKLNVHQCYVFRGVLMFQNWRTIIMAESSVTSLLSVKPEKINAQSMFHCFRNNGFTMRNVNIIKFNCLNWSHTFLIES